MLRITRENEQEAVTLRLEGRVTRRELGALDEAVHGCPPGAPCVVIDLAGVRFVDAAGAVVLRALRREPVVIRGGSPFVRELLEEGTR